MVTIIYSKRGLSTNFPISERLFEQVGNTLVRVVCESYYYGSAESLEDLVCEYMNTFMPSGLEIYTYHVTSDCSSGIDSEGKRYIKELVFQVLV